jgi:hypothetical protein
MTDTQNALPAKGSKMAIRSLSAKPAPKQNTTQPTAVVGLATAPVKRGRLGAAQRILAIGCLGIAVVGSTGCTMTSGVCQAFQTSECLDDFMLGYRNRTLAEKAWHRHKKRFCDERFMREFKDGFISGYVDVASGGNGCIPAVAPRQYWGWRYQSGNGQQAINAWFKGYPLGVQAAEQDGVGHWQQIQTMGVVSQQFAPATSGDEAGLANPFYPEQEYIPVPDAVEDFDAAGLLDGASLEPPVMNFGQTFQQLPNEIVDDGSELVLQPHIARRPDAVETKISDTIDESATPTPVVIDDIFGSSSAPIFSESNSDQLPFSFE